MILVDGIVGDHQFEYEVIVARHQTAVVNGTAAPDRAPFVGLVVQRSVEGRVQGMHS